MTKQEAISLERYINVCNNYFKTIGILSCFFQYASSVDYSYYKVYINTKFMINAFGEDVYKNYISSPQNAKIFWEHLAEVLYNTIGSPHSSDLVSKPVRYYDDNDSMYLDRYYIEYTSVPRQIFKIQEV